MTDDPRQRYRTLFEQSPDDPTGWFDRLYTEAESGRAAVPWDRRAPHPLLAKWARHRRVGTGGRALVVGCGPGDDAELVASLGFDTVGFDVSQSAIRAAHERYPSSKVDYVVADLFDPPAAWHQAFDLVVEVYTVQALPPRHHARTIEAVASLVAGTLVVISFARPGDAAEQDAGLPPWPLTRAEIDSFADQGLRPVSVELADGHWLAEFSRPGG